MSEINLPPFYIGQKVVFLDKESGIIEAKQLIKKDDVCIVMYLEFSDYNISGTKETWFVEVDRQMGVLYLAKDFAPVHENFQSISLTKVLEEETKLISVN